MATKDESIKAYTIGVFYLSILNRIECSVLLYVAFGMGEEDNAFVFNKIHRENLRGLLEISESYLACCIQNLMKKGFIRRDSRGVYLINPLLYFKGKEANRRKIIQEQKWDYPTKPTKQ